MTLDLSNPANRVLPRLLAARAEETPDAVFLMAGDATETFAETDQAVNRIANGLRAIGVGKGDRVAIIMGSRPDYVRLVLGVNRIGAIWVPINPDYKGAWLAEAICDTNPAALVVEEDYADRVVEVVDRIDVRTIVVIGETGPLAGRAIDYGEIANATGAPPPAVEIARGDTAAILWTSGTTGRPKGVMQSHNAWINVGEIGNQSWETRPDDIAYNCLPLYNSAAWGATIIRALVAGIPVAMDPSFSVGQFWDRIRHYGATQTMSLGAMHIFLWSAPARADDAANPLRIAAMTPLPDHLVDPMCARFGLEKIVQGYGQSEVQTLIQRSYTPGVKGKPNALGRVNPKFTLKLIDDDGSEVPPGTAGEFALLPNEPHAIFNGYFNDPDATARAYRGEWYCTGDLGMCDADGDYFFVDRKKDYIRYKGRSVSSFQVERVAAKFPAVAQCAAYGIPSAELETEHEIKLDVIARLGEAIDPVALARFINDNAPHFIVPRYIEIVESLPYTPTNKIEKYKLRERGLTEATWDRLATTFELAR